MTDLYNAERKQLMQAAIDAALEYAKFEGAASFTLPIKGDASGLALILGVPRIPIGEDTGLPLYRPASAALVAVGEQEPDLAELKELALAATPGPWTHSRFGALVAGPVQQYSRGSGQEQIAMTTGTNWMRKDEHIANADFIAAVNPAVVLDLIDRVSRLSLPVEAREVTDAEILAIAVESAKRYQSVSAVTDQGAIEFARAILAGRTT